MKKLLIYPEKSCECIWKEIIEFASWIKGNSWLFRGVGACNWEFLSSIDRFMIKHGLSWENYNEFLEPILNTFRSRAHHYINDVPDYDDLDEWFSYIQHYGGPTHFIDVTSSFFIALFFAADASYRENINSKGFCVYCMRKIFIDEYYTVPKKLNRRVQLQKGGFLRDKDTKISVNEILSNKFSLKDKKWDKCTLKDSSKKILFEAAKDIEKFQFLKIVFPANTKMTILRMLRDMNISYETLFPDLYGVVQEMTWFPYIIK